MIQLIQGPPRSGKSFFAIAYLMKFCKFDSLYMEYILNPEILIISNIEGLKIKHWELAECLKDRTLQEFFSIANFEAIMAKTRKTHIILLIDECHDYFPAGFQDKDIYSFFAYHGHIGLDIFLMTQGIAAMSRMFNPLLEHIVNVSPRSKSVAGVFSYTYTDLKGKYLYSKVIKKDKLVFGAYKSFRHDEQNKPKNALLIWAGMICAFLLVAGLVFNSALNTLEEKSLIAKQKTDAENFKDSVEIRKAEKRAAAAGSPPADGSPSPSVPVADLVAWRWYPVEGVLRIGGSETFVINGRRLGGERCRNFDKDLMMVEFYGLEIPLEPRASSGAAAVSMGAPVSAQGVALAKPAQDPFTIVAPVTDVRRPSVVSRSDKIDEFISGS